MSSAVTSLYFVWVSHGLVWVRVVSLVNLLHCRYTYIYLIPRNQLVFIRSAERQGKILYLESNTPTQFVQFVHVIWILCNVEW